MKKFLIIFLNLNYFAYSKEIKRPFQTPSSLAQGGTGVTNQKDLDSLLFNPANLFTKNSPLRLSLISPQLTISKDAISLFNQRKKYLNSNFKVGKIIKEWDKMKINSCNPYITK